jgi:signal transduction histidine kinase
LLHPASVEGRSLLLTEETVSRLRRGAATPELEEALGTPATVVPLDAGGELVGILACGRALDEPERELLDVLAREGALALRNDRLEAELRRQVEELRRSRRRLVDAQDAERRRIERDLHDGVQQQLVALAARLKRASLAAPTGVQDELREAAAHAEESVFALQELARGIYPSLLADQGLVAALRTHAGRLPAAVHVEVEPTLAGRRFGRELEAALYFVALEALANAQKHAPGAALTVLLRSTEDGTRLVLEVHDDGPGFDASKAQGGTGLQNMEDRIGAAGGTLTVDSRPGAGTWVRAELPLEAAVIRLQRSGDDSRR